MVVEAGHWVPPGARCLAKPLGRAQFLEGISGLALESLWLRPGCGGMKVGIPPISPCTPIPSLTSWACHHSPRSWPAT